LIVAGAIRAATIHEVLAGAIRAATIHEVLEVDSADAEELNLGFQPGRPAVYR
jgi:hypothetical protein